MTARRILLALTVVAVVGGAAAPALATEETNSRVCINATHDKNDPGPAILCVWLPGEGAVQP